MIKFLLMILLALTTAAICDEKESRARKIESATKGKKLPSPKELISRILVISVAINFLSTTKKVSSMTM